MSDITEKLENIIDKKNFYKDEPMSKHTSFKIGGKADYFIKVFSIKELKAVLSLAKNERIPFYIIGNGILVEDDILIDYCNGTGEDAPVYLRNGLAVEKYLPAPGLLESRNELG